MSIVFLSDKELDLAVHTAKIKSINTLKLYQRILMDANKCESVTQIPPVSERTTDHLSALLDLRSHGFIQTVWKNIDGRPGIQHFDLVYHIDLDHKKTLVAVICKKSDNELAKQFVTELDLVS